MEDTIQSLDRDGFVIVPGVFSPGQVETILASLQAALAQDASGVLGREGTVYAARNLLDLWPPAREVWREPPLLELLVRILGPQCGLVRVLFFEPSGFGFGYE
jgi:hypothetical protein